MMSTTAVLCLSWSRSGQVTRLSSPRTSLANFLVPASTPLLCGCFCCAFLLDPFVVADPRFLPITSFVSQSRAGGTRTHDLRFWRPLLFQLSYCPLPCRYYRVSRCAVWWRHHGQYFCSWMRSGVFRRFFLLWEFRRLHSSQASVTNCRTTYLQITGTAKSPSLCTNGMLLHYLGDDACSYSPSTLPDGKVQPLIHRYGAYQLHIHYRVVPWHHHLYSFFQTDLSRHIRGPEVELGAVVRKERRMTTPLFLREHIYLCLEAGVRCYGVGLGQHLPTLYVITLYSP